jgi:hypothetical protein
MTTRCTAIIRAAAFLIVALALWSMPASMRAQDDVKCACDHYTVSIDPALTCKVTVCYQRSPDGPTICTVLGPGDKVKIPCPIFEVSIQLCNGSIVIIDNNPVTSRCTDIFHVERDCCARACRTVDADGCPLVQVLATPCVNDVCP